MSIILLCSALMAFFSISFSLSDGGVMGILLLSVSHILIKVYSFSSQITCYQLFGPGLNFTVSVCPLPWLKLLNKILSNVLIMKITLHCIFLSLLV